MHFEFLKQSKVLSRIILKSNHSTREQVILSSYLLAQFYSVEESMYSILSIGWRSFIQWRRGIPFFLLASAVLFSGGEHVFLSSYWLAQFYSVEESMNSFFLLEGAVFFCGREILL
jgi:hypothetical protein